MSLRDLIQSINFEVHDGKLVAVTKEVDATKHHMNQAAAAVDRFGQRMNAAFTMAKVAVTGWVAHRVLGAVTTQYAANADASIKTARAVGLTAQSFQGLAHAAAIGGTDIDTFTKGMNRIAKNAYDANRGLKTSQDVFRDLNVEWKDSTGKLRPMESILMDVADRFKEMPNGTKKTALALNLFGKSGSQLINTLNEGSAGIKRLQEEAKKLGIVMSVEALKNAEKFNDEMQRTRSVFRGIKMQIGAALLPYITAAMRKFEQWARTGDNLRDALDKLKRIAEAVGVAITAMAAKRVVSWATASVRSVMAFASALRALGKEGAIAKAKTALLVGAALLLAAVVEDIYYFVAGGKETAIEHLFGSPAEAEQARELIRSAGQAMLDLWRDIAPSMMLVWKELGSVATMLWNEIIKPLLPYIATALKFLIKGLAVWIRLMTKLVQYVLIKPLMWMFPYLAKAVAWLAKVLTPVLAWLFKPVKWLFEAVVWGIDKLVRAWEWMADRVGGFITGIADWFSEMWTGLVAWLESIWRQIAEPFRKAADWALKKWEAVVKKIKDAYYWTKKALESAGKKAGNWIVDVTGSERLRDFTGAGVSIGSLLPAVPSGGTGPVSASPVAPGSRTSNVSVNTVQVQVQGSTNMTPKQLEKATARGIHHALRNVVNKSNNHRDPG